MLTQLQWVHGRITVVIGSEAKQVIVLYRFNGSTVG